MTQMTQIRLTGVRGVAAAREQNERGGMSHTVAGAHAPALILLPARPLRGRPPVSAFILSA